MEVIGRRGPDYPSIQERVGEIVERSGIKTLTFEMQEEFLDWGDSGATTAAIIPAISDNAIRIARNYSYFDAGALSQEAHQPHDFDALTSAQRDKILRSVPVLWDAVSTSWPIIGLTRYDLEQFLQSQLDARSHLSTEILDGLNFPASDVAEIVVDGQSVSAVRYQDINGFSGLCAEVSGERVLTVIAQTWAWPLLSLRFISSR